MVRRQTSWSRVRVAVVLGVVVAMTVLVGTGEAGGSVTAGARVQPNAIGELDCNGFSPIQRSVKPTMVCADPAISHQRFEDHEHYIGHDEPSLRFISSRPGSGSNVTWVERLPIEPHALPTTSDPRTDVTHSFELTVAPWFSMNLCDPNSDPQVHCTPRSDANAPRGRFPGGGTAFMELQFYPPGFAPFSDSISCDNTHWCSALTIDSVECDAGGTCNNNCIEPVNFAFIQTNGVPTGPPSPQESDLASVTPDAHTLMMNQGDRIVIHMFDARVRGGHALEITEKDLTNGRSGRMIASAANGFKNTSFADCSGAPFNFQPSYSTAKAANIVPWGFGPYNINTQFEIGHFEPCTTVTGRSTLTFGPFVDTYYNVCHGAYEADSPPDTGLERGAERLAVLPQGRHPWRHRAAERGDRLRRVLRRGRRPRLRRHLLSRRLADSVRPNRHPSPFEQLTPSSGGQDYGKVQFVTDLSPSESSCNLTTGSGCAMPPPGPGHFYPFWTRARVDGACVWEFGNMRNGNTFGGDRQWGRVGPRTLGAFTSRIRPTPGCE